MKVPQPGGHLDQLLRQTRAHHVQLSMMADQKANMLLTVSALVIPLSAQYLTSPTLGPAAIVMIGSSIVTLCLAAYAVMPKVLSRAETPRPGGVMFNPLFFGDFESLTYPQYIEQMERVMERPEQTYEAMVREVYAIGLYLARRKYRYLKLAYIAFMGGLTISIVLGVIWSLVGLINGEATHASGTG